MSFYLREPVGIEKRSRPRVEWDECACLLCGGSDWAPLVEAPDYGRGGSGLWFMVVQCHECGLCFTNPRPSASTIHSFYPEDYAPHQFKDTRIKGPDWWHSLPFIPRGPRAARRRDRFMARAACSILAAAPVLLSCACAIKVGP